MSKIYYAVYPRGDRLDLTSENKPVAFFEFKSQAIELKESRWSKIGEVKPMSRQDLIKYLTNDIE